MLDLKQDEIDAMKNHELPKGGSYCQCGVCKTLRRWREVLQIDTPEKEEVFDEIVTVWETEATDASWGRAILDGSWPNAEQILEQSLADIRAKKAD